MLLICVILCVPSAWAVESRLIDFEIQDQFKKKHRDEEYRGQIVVVIGSDRHGTKYNAKWGKAIADSLGEQRAGEVAWLAVADTRGAPFFLKGMIRGKFPKEKARWALTDWDGEFATAYDWVEKSSNILVFDQQGNLVARDHGTSVEAQQVEAICAVLNELMSKKTTPADSQEAAQQSVKDSP